MARDRFRLLTPESDRGTYAFNKHLIKHRFCPVCGTSPFSDGIAPTGVDTVAVNVRCLEGVDIDALEVRKFNGRKL